MSILVKSGRAAIAQAISEKPIHLAWGTGDVDWEDTPPDESMESTELLAEIGRRLLHRFEFVYPDDAGEIVVPTGRYAISETPTEHLFMEFKFDFEDGAEADAIREYSVHIGSKIIEGLPIGQRYFLPTEIENSGIMLLLEHSEPIHRSAASRQSFEFVITF